MYGVGTGAITMSNVVCTGSEKKIINCRYNTDTGGILNSNNNAQVQCQKGLFISVFNGFLELSLQLIGNGTNEWDVRLVGGSYLWEGHVEVFVSGSWTPVVDVFYHSNQAARVTCQQLGYTNYSKVYSLNPNHDMHDMFQAHTVATRLKVK